MKQVKLLAFMRKDSLLWTRKETIRINTLYHNTNIGFIRNVAARSWPTASTIDFMKYSFEHNPIVKSTPNLRYTMCHVI
jgi:hypothetical protein